MTGENILWKDPIQRSLQREKSRIPAECWEDIACWFSVGTTCGTVIVYSWSSQAQPWVRIACVDLKTKGVWAGLPEILTKPV